MSAIPGFDATKLHLPQEWEAFVDAYAPCSAGVGSPRVPNLNSIGLLPTGRALADATLDEVSAIFLALTEAGDADNPPSIWGIGGPARDVGGSPADVESRVKAALTQALVTYLWRCDGRGGLKTSTTGAYLPAPPMSSPPVATPADAASSPAAPASAAAGVRSSIHKRLADEISQATESVVDLASEGPESKLSSSEPASKKHSLIYVSIPKKVREVYVFCVRRPTR